MKLTDQIKQAMAKKKWTLRDLAYNAKVSENTAKKALVGGDVTIKTLKKVCKAVGVGTGGL